MKQVDIYVRFDMLYKIILMVKTERQSTKTIIKERNNNTHLSPSASSTKSCNTTSHSTLSGDERNFGLAPGNKLCSLCDAKAP